MNFKTFIFMILTFRRVDPIPRNIGLMLSTTFWISIVWIISNFTILIRIEVISLYPYNTHTLS